MANEDLMRAALRLVERYVVAYERSVAANEKCMAAVGDGWRSNASRNEFLNAADARQEALDDSERTARGNGWRRLDDIELAVMTVLGEVRSMRPALPPSGATEGSK